MKETVFIRLLNDEDKSTGLAGAVALLRASERPDSVYCAAPKSFEQIPGSPFAYWVSERMRKLFTESPRLENENRNIRVGLATTSDPIFVRLWVEVSPTDIRRSAWVPYAKGGSFSRYYQDVHLVVDWEDLGQRIKARVRWMGDAPSRYVASEDRYGQPGLTYPRRTQGGFNLRALPKGCIFANKGPSVFVSKSATPDLLGLLALLALMNSAAFRVLLSLQMAFGSYEVGVVQRTPVPDLSESDRECLSELSRRAWSLKRRTDAANETTHAFFCPELIQGNDPTLAARAETWNVLLASRIRELSVIQTQIDDRCFDLYDISKVDRTPVLQRQEIINDNETQADDDEDGDTDALYDQAILTVSLLSWAMGVSLGRFDVRLASEKNLITKDPDPFDSLPVCSPGMLVGPDGLPAEPGRIVSEEWLRARPDANTLPPEGTVKRATILNSEYPLDICWNGILVDDPGHPDDIITRLRQVFDVIWQDRAHEIYAEAVGILDPGKDDLRPWFRANFFADHIKRYSKSRRKAPIYWCLSTPSRSYAVWLYYHRFSKDTFYKVLDCVKLKLQLEERKLATLRVEIGDSPTSAQRRQLADQEKFVAELKTFHEEVALTAPFWKPDLNDGVVINFAPLWRLAPQPSSWQKECKQTWDGLVRGDYDWAHLAMHLWPERVVPKCHKDRSLAIAHGLEESLWEQDEDGKGKPRDISRAELNDLIAARSSRSVKDALEKLLSMPATAGNGGRRRRG